MTGLRSILSCDLLFWILLRFLLFLVSLHFVIYSVILFSSTLRLFFVYSLLSQQATFLKRHKGLLKKARELAVLCSVDVGLVIIDKQNKTHTFSSLNDDDDLEKIFAKFGTTKDKVGLRFRIRLCFGIGFGLRTRV